MKQLALKTFLQYQYASDIAYSNDGDKIAFRVSKAREEENDYTSQIHVAHGNQISQLTSGEADGGFIWDGNDAVLFSSIRTKKDKEALSRLEELSVFHRISTSGGEATEAFRIPLRVAKISKVKDGLYVLAVRFDLDYSHMWELSDEEKEELLKEKKENQDYEVMDEVPFYSNGQGFDLDYSHMWELSDEEKEELLKEKKENQDYEVMDEVPFYSNGQGFVNKVRTHLYLYDEEKDELTALIDGFFDVTSFELNKDKTEMILTGQSYEISPTNYEGVYRYDFEHETFEELLAPTKYSIVFITYFNNTLLFVGSEALKHGLNENGKFYTLDPETFEISLFKDYDRTTYSSVGSDARLGGGRGFKVVNDVLYFITTIRNASHLYSIDKDANLVEVINKEGSVDCFDLVDNEIALIGMYDNRLQEVYTSTLGSKTVNKLSSFNDEVLEDTYVADYHKITFINDGIDLDGWVLLPKDLDEDKTYPAILDIHGGPKTVYGEVFYHEMQLWANLGFIVFFMNPRGSDGRGNQFLDIFGKYGTIDYDDIMMFVDEVIKAYPQVDVSNIGVTGGSYGGFMTNWIVGHTNRFKCAATQRSISNWISFENTSDIGTFFAPDQIKAKTLDNIEKLWWHSPLKYAKEVKTPLLFIHSNEDYRCPLEQGLQFYTAIRSLGVESRFVMFKGENHELSRGGKPRHRVRRLEEITDWMEEYLK